MAALARQNHAQLIGGLLPLGRHRVVSDTEKAAYDASVANGGSCPETVFLSIGDLKKLLRPHFTSMRFMKRNCDDVMYKGRVKVMRKSAADPWAILGLDIYFRATRQAA